MGMSVEVQHTDELRRYQQLIDTLGNPQLKRELADSIGDVVESQTRRRLRDEKIAPDGTPWPEWSSAYAKTRQGDQALLANSRDLIDSITFRVSSTERIHVGSTLAYAAVHNDGFDGRVTVSAHVRRITKAFGRALKSPVNANVRSFTRAMHIPQREYLGLSQDNQTELLGIIGDFWQEVLHEQA